MSNHNPIQYTSRTYNTYMNDLNNDPDLSSKPNWFKRIIAGLGDNISMYQNAVSNQSFLATAFTRQAVEYHLALIDYFMSSQSTATGTLLFYLDADNVTFPKTIALADLAARSQGTIALSSKKYEARSSVVVNQTTETFTTNFAADNNLDVARVYTTGEKVRVSSTTTLPAPLQVNTDYYVIKISDTEIRLALSLSDAYNGVEITLTSDGVGIHTVELFSTQITCYQQETQAQVVLGTSDGTTQWQEFDLPDLNILEDTLVITINSVTWTKVATFVNSTSIDTHYRIFYNTVENSAKIMFGDGEYGAIPGNFEVNADYATGGGLDSNITIVDRINVYAGSDSDVLGVSNPGNVTGGSNVENIETAKVLGPLLLKARDRFVTSADGEALVLSFDGITRVIVIKNFYGLLSCKIPIVPSGGGLPTTQLKNDLQQYLIDRTILESIDVRVVDPTYITVTPIATVKVLTGFLFASIKPFVLLALRLLFSERTYEIQQDYLSNGIASAVSIINSEWSTSFVAQDYAQIITLLDNVEATQFDTDFQRSDVEGFVDSFVDGVDYIIISSPSFPITTASDEITTDNVLDGNITEIP